jgi:GDP-mannose 6-dehydrogenase
MVENIGDILEHSELLIIGNKNKEFEDTIKYLDDRHTVIDLVRILANVDSAKSNYDGICW